MNYNSYISFMGKYNNDPDKFSEVNDIIFKTLEKYNAKFSGVMRDITEPSCITFAGTIFLSCPTIENFREVVKNINDELDSKLYISSGQAGSINDGWIA